MGLSLESVVPAVRDNVFSVCILVLQEAKTSTERQVNQQYLTYGVQASNVIYGLMKLGCKVEQLPVSIKEHMCRAIYSLVDHMNEQESANIIYSLGIMNFKWNDLDDQTRKALMRSGALKLDSMISQGVTNIVYGLALMRATWSKLDPEFVSALNAGCIRIFSRNYDDHTQSSQGIANVVYSLGELGLKWEELPPPLAAALCEGIQMWGSQMRSQELSNTIYGLGSMRAKYACLPSATQSALVNNTIRVHASLNQQEICSIFHGLAKMTAQWDSLPEALKRCLFESLRLHAQLKVLCLACSIYALGLLGAKWEELPKDIRHLLVDSSSYCPLREQTFANVIYGLALLGVEWDKLEPVFRGNLLKALDSPLTLSDGVSQHCANTLWGLAKMDATWSSLPTTQLTLAFQRSASTFIPQEASNIIYGFANLDTAWTNFDEKTQKSIEISLLNTLQQTTTQEIANFMYSFALLTFDADYSVFSKLALKKLKTKKVHEQLSSDIFWNVHRKALERFMEVNLLQLERENFDQFSGYFELMRVIPGGEEFVVSMLGYFPRISGPCALIPSGLHAQTIWAMKDCLDGDVFSIQNEFNGLRGLFPVDAAVYYHDELLAFIEVDGEFHYKGSELRRKDRMKEFLYKHHYPGIQFYRVRSDQIQNLGHEKVGKVLSVLMTNVAKSVVGR